METFLPQTIRTYNCEICDFITSNKKDYQRHILSVKHIRRAKETADGQPLGKIGNFTQPDKPSRSTPTSQKYHTGELSVGGGYRCDSCGQVYQSKSGIWKHSKKCNKMSQSGGGGGGGGGDNALKTMMFDMLKNNQDFQNKVIEMMCVNSATAATAATAAAAAHSEITNSNNFNGTNYSHNKTFNLQFFLNEQCKDAMNISDFVSSITLKLSDLNDFGKMGYVEGISKIIIDNLRDTDIYKRPVHCSDAKRETLYVKDDNRWEREGPENEKMMNAVRVVEHKNISLINEWAKNNPRCEDSSTIENTQYLNLSRAVLDGDDQNIAKVIKRVTKEVVIDK